MTKPAKSTTGTGKLKKGKTQRKAGQLHSFAFLKHSGTQEIKIYTEQLYVVLLRDHAGCMAMCEDAQDIQEAVAKQKSMQQHILSRILPREDKTAYASRCRQLAANVSIYKRKNMHWVRIVLKSQRKEKNG